MKYASDLLIAVPCGGGINVEFRQGVHPRQVKRRLPPSPRPVGVVDVAPETARIEKSEQTPDLGIRQMDRHVELEQQDIVRPSVVGVTDEPIRYLLVRGIGEGRHPDKGITHAVERAGCDSTERRRKEEGGQNDRSKSIHSNSSEYL